MPEEIRTSDLNLATYLSHTRGKRLLRIEPESGNSRFMSFVFEASEEDSLAFHSSEEAKLFAALNNLKKRAKEKSKDLDRERENDYRRTY